MTKALTVQLSRPLRTPSGDFDGIILISLPVDSVTGAFKNLTLGKGGGVALVGTDDIFRAGTGAFSGRIGHGYREPETIGSVTVQRIAYVDKLNTVEKQIAEGLPRLVASRSVTNLPLQVMACLCA